MAIQFDESSVSGKMENNSRKLNSMLSMWYGVIIGSLQVYLIVQNIWKFVRFAELSWPSQETPTTELNIFIGLNGLAVLLLPFFVTACFLKVGNLANDNQMLGKGLKCTDDWSSLFASSKIQTDRSVFSSIWIHCGPVSSLIHIICSICLLFPQVLLEAVLIKHGFLPKENVWKSDLDFMNDDDPEDMVIRPIGDNGFSDFAKRVFPTTAKHDGLKLEFVNYAIALFIFSVRYAQVFWSSQKKFAVVFGLQQIFNNVLSLVSFCTLTVLYKVHVSNVYQKSTPFLLNSQVTMLIFAISLTAIFLSSFVLYYLGYLKFASFLHEKISKQQDTSCSSDTSIYGIGWVYFPHSCAVSIGLALAAAQSPLVHDAFIVHQISSHSFLMAFPICATAHLFLWIILWVCIALTEPWNFNVNATLVQPVQGLGTAGLSAELTIDLTENTSNGPFSPPLLVISEGKAFSVNSLDDQRSILSVLSQKEKSPEPVYWKKSTSTAAASSCLSYKQKDHSKIKYMPCRKEVTFDDELQSPRYYSRTPSRAEKPEWRNGAPDNCCANPRNEDFDEGEYAYLSRNSQLLKQSQTPRSTRECESLYSHLSMKMGFSERSTVASPVSTVDSSSGVSSISNKSNYGPTSFTTSCSQFSEGIISTGESDHRNSITIVEPTAHYEPVRLLSRRNSVRSYVSTPLHEVTTCENHPKITAEDIYGKLKGIKPGGRSESIYSSGTSKLNDSRFNRSVYEKSPRETDSRCNYSSNNPKFSEDCSMQLTNETSSTSCVENNSKIYGYLEDIIPPIPPPLPILSCVTRKSLTGVQSSSQTQVI